MKRLKQILSILLVVAALLPIACAVPLTRGHAAAADHISATYAANLSVKTDKIVGLMTEPTASGTAKHTVPANTMLTVKALHKNTAGTYWYEILYYDMTLYVDATAATVADHLTGDVTVTGLQTPAALGYGSGFPLKGTVSSTLNELGKITAAVHRSSNLSETPVLSSSDMPSGNSYSIAGNKVDNDLWFSDLAAGSYTFLLTAEAISYYIDGTGALATSKQTVVLDSKPLIVTNASSPNAVVAKGIDVSTWQGTINWASVSSQVDFAILRLGYSTSVDDQFNNNAAGCNANGVPFGVYLYSYATTEAQAVAEAEAAISVLKKYDVDLPIFFDIEDESQAALGATAIQNIVKAFCNTIRDAGYEPGLYTFLSWFNSYFTDSYYSTMPKWVAQVGVSSCSYGKGLTLWQYSWEGSFSGISGDVDCNYWYGEFPGKNTDKTFLGSCTYYPANSDATVTAEVNLRQYPSTDHTILETLAVGTQLHITGLYKAPNGSYWYQIQRNGATGYISCDYAQVTKFRYDDISVTDPTMADLSLGAGYYLKGELNATYNSLGTVNARVYAGENTLAAPTLTSSDAAGKSYTLNYSTVCDNMIFSDLATGYYTYELSADVKNYYYEGGLTSKTENVVVWTAPFTVGGASVTPPADAVCQHDRVTVAGKTATCTTDGLTDKVYCSKCGTVFTEQTVIPAPGHSYTSVSIPASCKDYAKLQFTCGVCGDQYSTYADGMVSDWSETKPDVDESRIEEKTQYRWSDYETVTSLSASLAGYTLKESKWVQSGVARYHYVDSWPSGFDTSHSVYTQYNNKHSAYENQTNKATVTEKGVIGYAFYHWCRGTYTEGPINRGTSPVKSDPYIAFHAFVAPIESVDPTTLTHASDGSVTFGNASCCTDSWWYYYTPIYEQEVITYDKQFTYERWTDYTDWSDTAVTASSTRKVETRTLYRYITAELSDHCYADGVCTVCGEVCQHSYVGGACTVCGKNCQHPSHGTDGGCLNCGVTVDHTYTNGACTVCGRSCQHPDHDTKGVCADCGLTVEHTFESNRCTVCGLYRTLPVLKPSYSTVSFEDEVLMNIYFTASDLGDLTGEDMGLITWAVPKPNGTIDDAKNVYPGAVFNGSRYKVSTDGIPAKLVGDTVYFKLYVKLADGTYVYSDMFATSPKAYAMSIINNTANADDIRALCVAMLDYGAQAQIFFGHKPYDLMNAGLSAEQRALVDPYQSGMVQPLSPVSGEKSANFVHDGGFSRAYTTVSFDSAFAINFYFTPAHQPDGDVTLYYWSPDTFDAVDVLTTENATASTVMPESDSVSGEYWGDLSGIAAKQIDQAAYVAAVYTSGGVTYTTNIVVYSLGRYCQSVAASNDASAALAAATAVYGYYAKQYFAAL